MEFLKKDEIDPKHWNQRIKNSQVENVFCYTWYLDAVSKNWGGLVSKNYNTILPIVYNSKLGVKKTYQPIFTREFDIFGSDFDWQDALTFLQEKYAHISFSNRTEGIISQQIPRRHQIIDLCELEQIEFKSTTRGLIKKGNSYFKYSLYHQPEILTRLFSKTSAQKIKEIGKREINFLNQLMHNALAENQGDLIVAKDENDRIQAAAFFLRDKQRITLLKTASYVDSKKSGVMYGLMHYAFEKYKSDYERFDFGGSEISSIANFFKKFGATDRNYYNYTIDNTPFWYNTIKRLKG